MANKISVYNIWMINKSGERIGKLKSRQLVYLNSQDKTKGHLKDGREVFLKDDVWFCLAE